MMAASSFQGLDRDICKIALMRGRWQNILDFDNLMGGTKVENDGCRVELKPRMVYNMAVKVL